MKRTSEKARRMKNGLAEELLKQGTTWLKRWGSLPAQGVAQMSYQNITMDEAEGTEGGGRTMGCACQDEVQRRRYIGKLIARE